jgi:hypothetical protein
MWAPNSGMASVPHRGIAGGALTTPPGRLIVASTVPDGARDRNLTGGPMDPSVQAWLQEFGRVALHLLPVGVLIAVCLWAVNWRRGWPVLGEGGWVPLVLIGLMAAVVWAQVFPGPALVFGFIPLPSGVWHLGAVVLLICIALACGWLQTYCGWYPPEIAFDPPPPIPHDDHGLHAVATPTVHHPSH